MLFKYIISEKKIDLLNIFVKASKIDNVVIIGYYYALFLELCPIFSLYVPTLLLFVCVFSFIPQNEWLRIRSDHYLRGCIPCSKSLLELLICWQVCIYYTLWGAWPLKLLTSGYECPSLSLNSVFPSLITMIRFMHLRLSPSCMHLCSIGLQFSLYCWLP